MESIQDLLFIEHKKALNERAELIKFFVENVLDKKGNQYSPKFIAIKLSHIKTPDLYYSISIFRDTDKRRGREGAVKEFWWSIKAKLST